MRLITGSARRWPTSDSGKLRVQSEAEQQLWNECSRLIANAIIFYNTVLLSKIYDQEQALHDEAAVEILRGSSPMAWRHVNLFGSIEFNDPGDPIDIDALAARYAAPEF
ncbi:Tn3 family transposase [Pseudomonas aeruginosa]|uniref:Tn3 family transposase n=1 Tax=Pseudomonas aeruginosa TaxID=287 RepID=UPI0034D26A57